MKLFFIFLFTLSIGLTAIDSRADTIELHADEWCPYTCTPNSDREGYLIDIARAIFEPVGHTIHFSTTPWNRALFMTKKNAYIAAPGAFISEGDGLIFPRISAGKSTMNFITLSKTSWHYSSIDSLDEIQQIAAIADYSYGITIDEFLKKNPHKVSWLHGENPLEAGFRMLKLGRVDAVIDDKNVLLEKAFRMQMFNEIRIAGEALTGEAVYIAFSPANSKGAEYANILSKGITELRSSGKLKLLLDKYNLTDWE